MRRNSKSQACGMSLVETILTLAASLVVGVFLAGFIRTSTTLFAKNVATNLSHNSTRSAVERLTQDVNAANGAITLVTQSGQAIPSGNASGIRIDTLRGYGFVVEHPRGAGLLSSSTAITLRRSRESVTASSSPIVGDVILIDGNESARLRVANSRVKTDGQSDFIDVSLAAPLGFDILWNENSILSAKVIRPVAYVAFAAGQRNELRFYGDAGGISDFSVSTAYSVLASNLGVAPGDVTPFSYKAVDSRNFLRVVLRLQAEDYSSLLSRERNNFSSVQRVELMLSPRGT